MSANRWSQKGWFPEITMVPSGNWYVEVFDLSRTPLLECFENPDDGFETIMEAMGWAWTVMQGKVQSGVLK